MDNKMLFFVSSRDGDLPTVERLVLNGVDINSENAGGATALEMAAESGRLNVVDFLIGRGARVDPANPACFSSALITASTNHHVEVVKALLAGGANPNLSDQVGQTALMWASFHGAPLEIIQELTSNGADVKLRDIKGNTALDYAVEMGHVQIAELLRQKESS